MLKKSIIISSVGSLSMAAAAFAIFWNGPFQWYAPLIRFYDDNTNLVAGVNNTLPLADGWSQIGNVEICQEWMAPTSFPLSRIQYYSSAPGLAYTALRDVNPDNTPGGLFNRAIFNSNLEGWQGENFAVPYHVEAGKKYFSCYAHENPLSNFTAGDQGGVRPVYYWSMPMNTDEKFDIAPLHPEPTVVMVPVDIKPQSCPNPLNIGRDSGAVSVAILGTDVLDVADIDPQKIHLAGVAPLRWEKEDVATPFMPLTGKKTKDDCTVAGADGFKDLVFKFDQGKLALALGEVKTEIVALQLTGNLHNGQLIAGEDVVWLLKKK